MPVSMPDGSVVLAGNVFRYDDVKEYKDGKPTGNTDGVKVQIAAEDGFSVVKLDEDSFRQLRPTPGQQILWRVIPALWEINGVKMFSTKFLRVVTSADLDQMGAILQSLEASKVPVKQ
jgi:hypothetical protein